LVYKDQEKLHQLLSLLNYRRKIQKKSYVVSLDVYRPAAQEQLKLLAESKWNTKFTNY
jgi:signal recognition particle GTPase